MRASTIIISSSPQIVPLNTYGKVGASVVASGAATFTVLANKEDATSVIAAGVTNGVIDYPADAVVVTSGIGQTVTICQYGD